VLGAELDEGITVEKLNALQEGIEHESRLQAEQEIKEDAQTSLRASGTEQHCPVTGLTSVLTI
jgi:hypothetical protein